MAQYLLNEFKFAKELRDNMSMVEFVRLNQLQVIFDDAITSGCLPWFDMWIDQFSSANEHLDEYIDAQRVALQNFEEQAENPFASVMLPVAREIVMILEKVFPENFTTEENHTVTIPAEEYESLRDDARWLAVLQAAGVRDWEGFEIAVKMYRDNFNGEEPRT